MKRILLVIAASTLLISPFALGQKPKSTDGQQKLVKVASINGAAAVREFQQNVQILQSERQAIVDLKNQLDKETNPKKKRELQARLDAGMKKLEENNTLMAKTYGFSLARNYTMEIDSASIYMAVSDEEAAKVEQAAKEQAAKARK